MPLMDYTTLQNVKAYLDIPVGNTASDNKIGLMITEHSRLIDRMCRQSLSHGTYTNIVTPGLIDPNDGSLICYVSVPMVESPLPPGSVSWKFSGTPISSYKVIDIVTDPGVVEVETKTSGTRFRFILPAMGSYRGAGIEVRLNFTGGFDFTPDQTSNKILNAPAELVGACTNWVTHTMVTTKAAGIKSKKAGDFQTQYADPHFGPPPRVAEALKNYKCPIPGSVIPNQFQVS